jgi:hypothetical protein
MEKEVGEGPRLKRVMIQTMGVGGHGLITADSKQYIKSSHYIFSADISLLIHQISKLFTNCGLRARKNYFTLCPFLCR